MKQIRQNIFETNSSSTHSICVAKEGKLEFPKALHFELGEFGWEEDTLTTVYEKASYLYTALYVRNMGSIFDFIVECLEKGGIEITYDPNNTDGYIDHGHDLDDFIYGVTSNEESILNYLFNPLSYVLTGNDNNPTDVEIKESYEHEVYYKGN